ncbi:hypothetical protein G6F56_000731 [Rhizopus delemar]|uniref:CUE domain-containing protein n=1 Tax=Rhizopus stolonifer TaxID=4846 RepID=A0A367KVQ9_RHIST|nr:hypothetical protein G6F56_000731 [Rhizopus delemar]RCI06286.1 hypothetical protein CU098_013508 [Rhizopus stolonifer]
MEFIRFIPYNVDFQDIWKAAFKTWKSNLSILLNMDDSIFIRSTDSPSFVDFVHQVWDAHLDGERVDRILLQYIFFIYVRLARLSNTANHPLLQTNMLVKLAIIYCSSNKLQLRENIQVFTERLAPTLNTLVESIESLSRLDLDEEVLKKAYVLTQTFEALISTILPDFLPIDTLIIDWYASLVPHLKKAVDTNPELSSYAYLIKKSLVSVFQVSAELQFFQPLGYAIDDTGDLVLSGEVTNADKAIEFLSQWIGQSEIKLSSAFVDAPLIMDWESAYDISVKIGQMNQTLFSGENEMLQILQLQMEQVRDTLDQSESWQVEEDDREQKMAQIREILGDVSDDTIENYLDENNNDAEVVIMKLLQNESQAVLSNRKNVYDNDEFDVFSHNTIDTSKVYVGKKDKGDADLLLHDKSSIDKSSVMKRVVDMYEEEYEDSLDDINDANGVVTMGTDEAHDIVKQKTTLMDPGIQHESLLVHLFMETPDILSRNSTARKSPKRAELRDKTGMSDEQLEGWAIMFGRNPRKQRILDKYMLFDGKQTEMPKKVQTPQKSQTPQTQQPKKSNPKDHSSKEKNKARVGNHNRKNMRDKKLSKAGPPPS